MSIATKLIFLRHYVQDILIEDFDAIEEPEMAIASALRALEEYELSLQLSNVKDTAPV